MSADRDRKVSFLSWTTRYESGLTVRVVLPNKSFSKLLLNLLAPEPPEHGKERNQRQNKKEGTAATMDRAVNHMGTDVHAEQRDHQIRTAFRKSPNGITAATNRARRHVVRRNMFAASRLVILQTFAMAERRQRPGLQDRGTR